MENVTNAVFALESYKVSSFSFTEPPVEKEKLDLRLYPTGEYYPHQQRFKLLFTFEAGYTENEIEISVITITTQSEFTFDQVLTLDTLPNYFFSNSIAIVFPFVRAFVATLTTIANVKQIILPILNLTTMQEILKTNTIVFE